MDREQAQQILNRLGVGNAFSFETVRFGDLARIESPFLVIKDWTPDPKAQAVIAAFSPHGAIVEFQIRKEDGLDTKMTAAEGTVMPEPGDWVRLLFSTMYVEGLHRGARGTVAAIDGSGTFHVLWETGAEQELRICVKPYRLLTRAFLTKAHGGGRLVMELLDDKSKAAGMPKPEDRVEFLASIISSPARGLWRGNKGTVNSVDKRGVVSVSWDNGAEITLVLGWDTYRILPEKDKGGGLMLEIGDEVELVFSTMCVDGLCPGLKGTVTGLDGSDITSVLWNTGVEQELIPPGADTYRVMSRSFATEAHGIRRLVMQSIGDKAVPPPLPPKPGDRVEFLFSALYLGGGLHWGSAGKVLFIDDLGTIHVRWDNGANLGLIPDWDHFRILPKGAGGDADVAETG